MSEELEKRTAERRAELERMKFEKEFQCSVEFERAVTDFPQILVLACEFLNAFGGVLMMMIGRPETGAVLMLTAIYLRMGRKA